MTVGTVSAIQTEERSGQPFTVEVHAITNKTNTDDYTLVHTFNTPNDGPAQKQQFLNCLARTIAKWIVDFQGQHHAGTDIYGGLHKVAMVSEGLVPNEEIVAVFLSDLIHEQIPDPGPAHFMCRTRVFYILSNSTADPRISERARRNFVTRVRQAGGLVQPAADVNVFHAMLHEVVIASR
jgi:hypothetical protein